MADTSKVQTGNYTNAMSIIEKRGLTQNKITRETTFNSVPPTEAYKNTVAKDTTINFGKTNKTTGNTIDSIGNLLSRGLNKTIETIDSGLDKVAGWFQ